MCKIINYSICMNQTIFAPLSQQGGMHYCSYFQGGSALIGETRHIVLLLF